MTIQTPNGFTLDNSGKRGTGTVLKTLPKPRGA